METPIALAPRAIASPTYDAQSNHSSPAHASRYDKYPTSPAPPPASARPTLTPIDTSHASSSQAPVVQRADKSSAPHASSSRQRTHVTSSSAPDPLLDITRLRVRSQGHHCLYPGATFQGTQKSGRNSYDVNVTIVVRPEDRPCSPEVLSSEWCFRTSISHHLTCAGTSAYADSQTTGQSLRHTLTPRSLAVGMVS